RATNHTGSCVRARLPRGRPGWTTQEDHHATRGVLLPKVVVRLHEVARESRKFEAERDRIIIEMRLQDAEAVGIHRPSLCASYGDDLVIAVELGVKVCAVDAQRRRRQGCDDDAKHEDRYQEQG